ncbi:phospholipase D family protein [Parasedimentitalea psychrophila]|uniref:Phospholipase D family protein n=1 Tax=Parasedimentitalea psychrophila TaxID=2997337 RepID=A0A9Y2KXD9_9RHOB|nr:phospholipase D family protein [Parasedimentitalea psychrophila]WIY23607.1 phospholipase D family protein [Parasedimentitalea psychrophila]
MGEFLSGDALSKKIQEVCKGDNVRIAAAFWGIGAVDTLFDGELPKGAKIICDISMGGTNPAELKKMRAPDNPKLRFLDGLHAKVYLSDKGCVVGSANASNNGVGFGGNPSNIEAGVFSDPETLMWKDTNIWMKSQWNFATELDEQALTRAELKWEKRSKANWNGIPPKSGGDNKSPFFQSLLADPESSGEWGFVFSHGDHWSIEDWESSEDEERTEQQKEDVSKNWNDRDFLYGFSKEQLDDFPEFFVQFYWGPRGGLQVHFLQMLTWFFSDEENGYCVISRILNADEHPGLFDLKELRGKMKPVFEFHKTRLADENLIFSSEDFVQMINRIDQAV